MLAERLLAMPDHIAIPIFDMFEIGVRIPVDPACFLHQLTGGLLLFVTLKIVDADAPLCRDSGTSLLKPYRAKRLYSLRDTHIRNATDVTTEWTRLATLV
jgi:hypothetical protein